MLCCSGKNMEISFFSAFWQKPSKANENHENCRENKPYTIYLNIIIYSNSAGKPWQWTIKIGLGRNEIIRIMLCCNGKNMEIAIFPAFWQKPPKANEHLENYRKNKPCTICLYLVIYSNSAGKPCPNGRMKLGLGPIAQ
jgi:hypothetical protein